MAVLPADLTTLTKEQLIGIMSELNAEYAQMLDQRTLVDAELLSRAADERREIERRRLEKVSLRK